MSTGEALKGVKQLLKQIDGVQVVGCLCVFSIPRLNGKKKIEGDGIGEMKTKYASLIDLDKLKIENQLINMVNAKKQEILLAGKKV